MMKRFLALCLACTALLSLSAPALAARSVSGSGFPKSATGATSVTIPRTAPFPSPRSAPG